jgi:hypothetical protein
MRVWQLEEQLPIPRLGRDIFFPFALNRLAVSKDNKTCLLTLIPKRRVNFGTAKGCPKAVSLHETFETVRRNAADFGPLLDPTVIQ